MSQSKQFLLCDGYFLVFEKQIPCPSRILTSCREVPEASGLKVQDGS